MAVTKYYTANGRIRGESTNGVRTTYGTDALGSVTGTYDQNGDPQNTYLWAPYGTLVQKTGTASDPKFGWNGSSGYRNNARNYSGFYVRHRHYDNLSGQWATNDPVWPIQPAFAYAGGNPAQVIDPLGLFFPEYCTVAQKPTINNVRYGALGWGYTDIEVSIAFSRKKHAYGFPAFLHMWESSTQAFSYNNKSFPVVTDWHEPSEQAYYIWNATYEDCQIYMQDDGGGTCSGKGLIDYSIESNTGPTGFPVTGYMCYCQVWRTFDSCSNTYNAHHDAQNVFFYLFVNGVLDSAGGRNDTAYAQAEQSCNQFCNNQFQKGTPYL